MFSAYLIRVHFLLQAEAYLDLNGLKAPAQVTNAYQIWEDYDVIKPDFLKIQGNLKQNVLF